MDVTVPLLVLVALLQMGALLCVGLIFDKLNSIERDVHNFGLGD